MGTRQLQRRLDKFETRCSRKWYLWIFVGADESDDDAIRRTAAENGIRLEDIGYAMFLYLDDESPGRPIKNVDFGGHGGKQSLRGYISFEALLRQVIAEENEQKAAAKPKGAV